MPRTAPSLKGRALRLLATREHSRVELERKLAGHEVQSGELAQLLDDLQAKGFIDERRVAESLLHRRADRLGAARVRQELQAKGLDADLVNDAVAGLRATELQRARAVRIRRFGDSPPVDRAERARQARFLAARGFSTEAIRHALDGHAAE